MRMSVDRTHAGEPILLSKSHVAQQVEHRLDKAAVVGSIPTVVTNFSGFFHGVHGAAASASGCDPEGRRFESGWTPQFVTHAGIAQLVELPAFNREVRRSSRRARTNTAL
jgi:hypothetical protein